MKLSELKPCGACGGPLRKPPHGAWYDVRISAVILDPQATRETLGTMALVGGSLPIAEALSPNADAVIILGERDPEFYVTAQICFDCALRPVLDVQVMIAKRREAGAEADSTCGSLTC